VPWSSRSTAQALAFGSSGIALFSGLDGRFVFFSDVPRVELWLGAPIISGP
jgi:hypothetical protein